MRAFTFVDIDHTLVVVVSDPKLAAAVRALGYAYEEKEDGDVAPLIEALNSLYSREVGEENPSFAEWSI